MWRLKLRDPAQNTMYPHWQLGDCPFKPDIPGLVAPKMREIGYMLTYALPLLSHEVLVPS